MVFKCKNCGGNVVYSPEKKKMFCPFCESEDSQERLDKPGNIEICPNCSGEVPVKEHTSAVQCPYCDTYLILNERIEGQYTPNYIIPFQYGKEMVKNLMREKFAKYLFAPMDFLSEVKLNSMEGDYVPFWFYDYNVKYFYQGEGKKIRIWRTGETEYTETSIYSICRDMEIPYYKIPADASEKMPDEVMDLLEPYQYDSMIPFHPQYMSGFQGEKYNMPSEVTEPRSKAKMQESAEKLLMQTIIGYQGVVNQQKELSVQDRKVSYGLLPVWVYNYRYKEKEYPFYINGQTAKIVGKVPVSKTKVTVYGLTLWFCLTAILSLLYGIWYLW